MPLFSYTAKDSNGETIRGSLHGSSLADARKALIMMNLEPVEIHEVLPDANKGKADALNSPAEDAVKTKMYFPIHETLRLYAGWILSGYIAGYLLGGYKLLNPLPFDIPFALTFLMSPVIMRFSLAFFLFLLGSSIFALFGKKTLSGIIISTACIGIFLFVHTNIP